MKHTHQSPFAYGKAAGEGLLIDRSKEIKQLVRSMRKNQHVFIEAPSGYGKTVFLKQCAEKIRQSKKKIRVAWINGYAIDSEQAFLNHFVTEMIKATSDQWQEWLLTAREVLGDVLHNIHTGERPERDFYLILDKEKALATRDELIRLPERIAVERGEGYVVIVDDFQRFLDLQSAESFLAYLRGQWEVQQRVSYCFNIKGIRAADRLFYDETAVFHGFASVHELKSIEPDVWTGFIRSAFEAEGRQVGKKTLALIPDVLRCHPASVQQLLHYCWLRPENKVGREAVAQAMGELLNVNTTLYRKELDALSRTQINLLKAILMGEKQLTSAAVMRNYDLGTPRNVAKNRLALEHKEVVCRRDGSYEMLDPAFEIWFRKMFLPRYS